MKTLVAVTLLSLALTGCVNPGKASVQKDQLQNHRFALETVNGAAVKPELNSSSVKRWPCRA